MAVAVLAVVLFVANPSVRSGVRSHQIPEEDLRTPTRYIAAHQRPGDVVVVAMLSNWGFAYYWDEGQPATEPVTSNLQGFVTVFPDQPNILVATDRTEAAVTDVMDKAARAAAAAGPNARVWFIVQHGIDSELQAYATCGRRARTRLAAGDPGLARTAHPGALIAASLTSVCSFSETPSAR